MSHNRNTKYLDDKRVVYKRDPITDKPTQENENQVKLNSLPQTNTDDRKENFKRNEVICMIKFTLHLILKTALCKQL